MNRVHWSVLAILFLVGGQLPPALGDDAVTELIQWRVEQITLGQDNLVRGVPIVSGELLADIYARRQFAPLWTNDQWIDDLQSVLASATEHGLNPRDYLIEDVANVIQEYERDQSIEDIADLEILLTEALIRFGYHQIFGKVDPATLDADWNVGRALKPGADPATTVPEIIESGRIKVALTDLIERGPIYRAIQAALAEYRDIAVRGGWPQVDAGPTLQPGDSGPRVVQLRGRLAATGDFRDGELSSEVFDLGLESAVRNFQERHGLTADGIVGPASIAALNVPVEMRVNQLRLSLERLRWIDRDFPEKIVIVNIAGFETYLIHNRQIVWRSRVMVGKTYRKTPVFMGKMSYVQVNPTWTVPPTILRNDILPKVKRDPSYLRERNISVINRDGEIVDPDSVDWNSYGNSVPFTLRQEPGPTNALGRVKFIFPNPHFVFLHDTPSRQLFDRPDRTFSSGCIRVENPFELAELMIDDPGRWNQASFDRQLESGKIKTIYTKDKMPVLIMYWTAEAGLDGRIRFFKDVYERDERLLKALDGPVGFNVPGLPNR